MSVLLTDFLPLSLDTFVVNYKKNKQAARVLV